MVKSKVDFPDPTFPITAMCSPRANFVLTSANTYLLLNSTSVFFSNGFQVMLTLSKLINEFSSSRFLYFF